MRQQDVDRSDQGAAGGAIRCVVDLSVDAGYQGLMTYSWRRRHRVGHAVDQFPALVSGPLPLVGIGER